MRIVARRLGDGRVEFALQRRVGENPISWGERMLPRLRFFPTDAASGRWLRSSPLHIEVALDTTTGEGVDDDGGEDATTGGGEGEDATTGEGEGGATGEGVDGATGGGVDGGSTLTLRITARRLSDGRIEFAAQQRGAETNPNSWGERLLPRLRFFPTGTAAGRWLRSSPLTLAAPVAAGGTTPVDGDPDTPPGAATTTTTTPGTTTTTTTSTSTTVTSTGRAVEARDSAAADPGACRPRGVGSQVTAGFPLPPNAVASTGTARVAVFFVDFPNAVATHTTEVEAAAGLPDAERYLETTSYGKLDVEFVPHHGWLRAPQRFEHYLPDPEIVDDVRLYGIGPDAVALADPRIDFSSFDSLMIVMPSTHFYSGFEHRNLTTDEGTVRAGAVINTIPTDEVRDRPVRWRFTAAHEFIHHLGLVDYYPYDRSDEIADAPAGQSWVTSAFGMMEVEARFLADDADQRRAFVVTHPNGNSTTRYTKYLLAREMLAWSRWQLGWLEPSQVRCLGAGADSDGTGSDGPESDEADSGTTGTDGTGAAGTETGADGTAPSGTETGADGTGAAGTETAGAAPATETITLAPAAAPGDGIVMAAIPLSDTKVLVVEARRSIGWDAPRPYTWPNGDTTAFPGLVTEGVLVYTVDAGRHSGDRPLRIAGQTITGQGNAYPILTPGQSVTVAGYTVTVQSAGATTHTVTITPPAAS